MGRGKKGRGQKVAHPVSQTDMLGLRGKNNSARRHVEGPAGWAAAAIGGREGGGEVCAKTQGREWPWDV